METIGVAVGGPGWPAEKAPVAVVADSRPTWSVKAVGSYRAKRDEELRHFVPALALPHLILEGMDDQELNKVLRAYSEAWRRYASGQASPRVEPKLRPEARAAIDKLRAEANRVPDPGGPITNYGAALDAWAAANHPEIDSSEMWMHVTDKLVFEHAW